MNAELEKKLVEKYPTFFRGKDLPPTQSLMCFGCECGDGWYHIIDNVCTAIKWHIESIVSSKKYNPDLPDPPEFVFMQIKEKFGGIRLYASGVDDFIDGVISMAERMSFTTCEQCGNIGRSGQRGSWCSTCCDKCAPEGWTPYTPEELSGGDD